MFSSVKMPATRGDATLVPPYTCHWLPWTTATPVFGSATAETSASMRLPQRLCDCHDGLGMYALQPLPESAHTVSAQPRDEDDFASDVPPTASTYCEVAGNSAPYAWSPALAVTRTPG
jgi:hypothetical protein